MVLKNILPDCLENNLSSIKWHASKQAIIKTLISEGDTTISELSLKLQLSIPTVTKAINELIGDELVIEAGKVTNNGGRRPSLYSISSSSIYFLGIEINRPNISIGIQNVKSEFVAIETEIPMALENSQKSLTEICDFINSFIDGCGIQKSKIVGACINLPGRVNSEKGTSQYYFANESYTLAEIFSQKINIPVSLENDTRAMVFGEYKQGIREDEKDVMFLNYGWGLCMGLIFNNELYYGKSGYSGEFGHYAIFDTGKLCHCGKVGCLETEISGWALVDQFKQALAAGKQSRIQLDDSAGAYQFQKILDGAMIYEDNLCIELITRQCELLGRYLSGVLNILNPDLVIVGGDFVKLNDFIMLPLQTAIKKYTLSLVNKDAKLKKTNLGNLVGVTGACNIVKERMLSSLG